MDDQHQAARIKFRIRRGMLELDSMLQNFYQQHYGALSADQKVQFEKLLDESDQDLWRWLLGIKDVDKDEFKPLIELIKSTSSDK